MFDIGLITLVPGAAALAVGAVVTRGVLASRSRLFGPLTCRGTAGAPPRVALTFDDGPDPEATPRILDCLDRLRVPAAFCIIGVNAERWPKVVADVDARGHVLVNHSFHHHRYGTFRHRRYWRREVGDTETLLHEITGRRPRLFRPPMGFKNPQLMDVLRKRDLVAVTWTRRGHDGVRTSTDRIVERLGRHQDAGDILTLHDGCEPRRRRPMDATIDAIPRIVEAVRRHGLEFSRLDELIGEPAYRESV